MLHMTVEIHGCSGLRELVLWMDLNARVDVNCGRKDGRMGRQTDGESDAFIASC